MNILTMKVLIHSRVTRVSEETLNINRITAIFKLVLHLLYNKFRKRINYKKIWMKEYLAV